MITRVPQLLMALVTVAGLNLQVETLDGNQRSFPRDAAATRSVFIVTFSKAASGEASAWTRRLQEVSGRLSAEVFHVAVLEDVPRLLRPVVRSSIARDVPASVRNRFWVATTNKKVWQQCADGSNADEAHVFVLDRRERIVWRAHGACSDARIAELLALGASSTQ